MRITTRAQWAQSIRDDRKRATEAIRRQTMKDYTPTVYYPIPPHSWIK